MTRSQYRAFRQLQKSARRRLCYLYIRSMENRMGVAREQMTPGTCPHLTAECHRLMGGFYWEMKGS